VEERSGGRGADRDGSGCSRARTPLIRTADLRAGRGKSLHDDIILARDKIPAATSGICNDPMGRYMSGGNKSGRGADETSGAASRNCINFIGGAANGNELPGPEMDSPTPGAPSMRPPGILVAATIFVFAFSFADEPPTFVGNP